MDSIPCSAYMNGFSSERRYDQIHRLQPQVLVAYKQGVTGTEDYFAPEHAIPDSGKDPKNRGKITVASGKPLEVCTTMCPGSWGYCKDKAGEHLSAEQVWAKLCDAAQGGYNLLLNTGPLPDGSLDPEDVAVLRTVGTRLRKEGFPEKK